MSAIRIAASQSIQKVTLTRTPNGNRRNLAATLRNAGRGITTQLASGQITLDNGQVLQMEVRPIAKKKNLLEVTVNSGDAFVTAQLDAKTGNMKRGSTKISSDVGIDLIPANVKIQKAFKPLLEQLGLFALGRRKATEVQKLEEIKGDTALKALEIVKDWAKNPLRVWRKYAPKSLKVHYPKNGETQLVLALNTETAS
jgi:hypothetical protein